MSRGNTVARVVAARRRVRRRLPPRRQPTTAERGYGRAHAQLRRQVKRVVDRGGAVCWRCGRWIRPGEAFDLGHSDHRLAKHLGLYEGPEHRSCSRSAGAWKRHGYAVPPSIPPRSTGPRPKALGFFDPKPVDSQLITDDSDE